MKLHIASLLVLCLGLGAAASAQQLYDNGSINGTTDAWTINFGYVVSNNFKCCKSLDGSGSSPAGATMTGFEFGAWEFPGDVLSSVDWSVTTAENGGTVIGSGTASGLNLTDQFVSSNQFGYDIDHITVTGLDVALASDTTYWLNLQNATVPSGDPVYWDENSGPSSASESSVGTIPSEAFTIDGTSSGGTTPEPGSILLFGSGILGVAGMVRRKLRL